jgi:hypothetical protein
MIGDLAVPVWLCALGTVVVEFALAIGFWFPRTRIATALLGVTFHGILRFIIRIGWLDWASVFLYSSFLLPFEARKESRSMNGSTDSPVPDAEARSCEREDGNDDEVDRDP